MTAFTDPQLALAWVVRLAALGVLIDALQRLVCWRAHRDEGVLGWAWLRTRRRWLRWPPVVVFLRHPHYLGALALQGVAALFLVLFPRYAPGRAVAVWVVFGVALLTHLRNALYGLYGANRMLLVIFVALACWSLAPESALVTAACLWFLALRACLSYATAGWYRLTLPSWRRGTALYEIFNTPMLGSPRIASLLGRHPWMNRALTWSTWVMECSFPLVLLVGFPAGYLFLGWGVAFHLGIAVTMGLNTFVWAWLATYPAIIYSAYAMQGRIGLG